VAGTVPTETLITLQPGPGCVQLWVFPVWTGEQDLQRTSNYFNFMISLQELLGRALRRAVVSL